jgi:starvation-inducible DNA-binding protein
MDGRLDAALNAILADAFALCLKTKRFHWTVDGRNHPELHSLLVAQGDELYVSTDPIADRARRSCGFPPRSAPDMLEELQEDNTRLAEGMRLARLSFEQRGDWTTAGLLDVWIAEAEQRAQALLETRWVGKTRAGRPGSLL